MTAGCRVEDLPARLAAKIRLNPETGCWEWLGRTQPGGYGSTFWEGRRQYTHRVVYTLLIGPIPEGLTLDHVKARGCTSTACCRPEHLEPVTMRENILRSGGPTAVNAGKTHCPQGHEYTAENTYVRPSGGRRCRTCKRQQENARTKLLRATNESWAAQERERTREYQRHRYQTDPEWAERRRENTRRQRGTNAA